MRNMKLQVIIQTLNSFMLIHTAPHVASTRLGRGYSPAWTLEGGTPLTGKGSPPALTWEGGTPSPRQWMGYPPVEV